MSRDRVSNPSSLFSVADLTSFLLSFSYFDTQISRLGVNFSEVPINQPVCPVMSNNRDGALRRKIHKGKVNYHPNRFDASVFSPLSPSSFLFFSLTTFFLFHFSPHAVPEEQGGYAHSKAPVGGVKIKALGPKFADHYSQAQMFYNSMSPVEKIHQVVRFHSFLASNLRSLAADSLRPFSPPVRSSVRARKV